VHWLSSKPGERPLKAELRLYDHLMPEDDDVEAEISPTSEVVVKNALIEPIVATLATKQNGDDMVHVQFERVGYFVADCVDSRADALVLNRTIGLMSFVPEEKSLQKATSSRTEIQQAQRAAKVRGFCFVTV